MLNLNIPIPETKMAPTYRQRFYSKIRQYSSLDECHIWEGHRDPSGYGDFNGKRAHRVAWELECSEIPEGYVVRHYECDNPPCVNVRHLRIGTHLDNSRDKILKSRHLPNNDKITRPMIHQEILLNQLKNQLKDRREKRLRK